LPEKQTTSKMAEIKRLLKEGQMGRKQIAERLNTTYGYVRLVAWDLKNPGALNKAVKDYTEGTGHQKIAEYRKKWRTNNPKKRSARRKKDVMMRQEVTKPKAKNHRQGWTIRDIKYVEKNRSTKTIKELALELGRTFLAVQRACHKHSIMKNR